MLIVTHEMNFAREVADRVLFFADGGIYEEGTPDKIFDSPEREKTIAFIRKLKYFSYDITSRDFDLLAMQGGIHDFGEKYGLSSKLVYRLELCCEELVYEMNIEISYSEADGSTLIDLTSAGKKFNPFDLPDDELLDDSHMGIMILKKVSKGNINYSFSESEGLNKIEIKL